MMAEILLFQRLKKYTGAWMDQPDDWVWTTPALDPQGFGLFWRDNVGLANLLWLALDMERPPDRPYNMRYHPLCTALILQGPKVDLDGLPIHHQAEALTLAQFRNLCESEILRSEATQKSWLVQLAQLANRRLAHAHA